MLVAHVRTFSASSVLSAEKLAGPPPADAAARISSQRVDVAAAEPDPPLGRLSHLAWTVEASATGGGCVGRRVTGRPREVPGKMMREQVCTGSDAPPPIKFLYRLPFSVSPCLVTSEATCSLQTRLSENKQGQDDFEADEK